MQGSSIIYIYITVFDKLFVVLNILSMFLIQSPDFHYSAIVELKESSGSIKYLNSGNRRSIAKELTNVILTETQEILLKDHKAQIITFWKCIFAI